MSERLSMNFRKSKDIIFNKKVYKEMHYSNLSNKLHNKYFFILNMILFFSLKWLHSFSYDFTNHFSAIVFENLPTNKFQPDLQLKWFINNDLFIIENEKLEVLVNVSLQNQIIIPHQRPTNHKAEIYRAWVRIGSMQTSMRFGLQQLNFGSAQFYRPLQWFDFLNPLDLTDETKGVEAILLRHFFESGANLWMWGIRGKDELKGLELIPSEKNSIESGGRIQFPLLNSETAFTFHNRKVKLTESSKIINEYRFGFDMRTDSIFGFWLETAGSYIDNEEFNFNLQAMSTIGLDYTFSWGNGLYLLSENAVIHSGEAANSLKNEATLSAIMIDYPLSMFDKITLLNQYEWKEKATVHTLIFRRTYDHISFQINLTYGFGAGKVDSAKYMQLTVNYDI